jgi:hypothetical protein
MLKAVWDRLTFYLFISTKECIYFESHYGSPFLFYISLALMKKKKKKSTLELRSAKDILTKFKETGNEWFMRSNKERKKKHIKLHHGWTLAKHLNNITIATTCTINNWELFMQMSQRDRGHRRVTKNRSQPSMSDWDLISAVHG